MRRVRSLSFVLFKSISLLYHTMKAHSYLKSILFSLGFVCVLLWSSPTARWESNAREKKRDDKLMWKLRKVVVFLGTFSRRSNVLNRRFLFLDDCHLLHTIHYTRMWHFSSLPLYAARIQITHSTHHTIYFKSKLRVCWLCVCFVHLPLLHS